MNCTPAKRKNNLKITQPHKNISVEKKCFWWSRRAPSQITGLFKCYCKIVVGTDTGRIKLESLPIHNSKLRSDSAMHVQLLPTSVLCCLYRSSTLKRGRNVFKKIENTNMEAKSSRGMTWDSLQNSELIRSQASYTPHTSYKQNILQEEERIMNTRNIMQLQIKLISKHLFNLLNYVTSANGCFSACSIFRSILKGSLKNDNGNALSNMEILFIWKWEAFVHFLRCFLKNSTLSHTFQLTLGTQFCDNLASQVSGEALLYSDGHQETASSWFLEYESLSETQVMKKWKKQRVGRKVTGATEGIL